jgi:hypothetical protein
MFDFVAHADDFLLRAWNAKPRDWGTLVRFCLMVAVALGILCFVVGFVLVFIASFIASFKTATATKFAEAFFFAWSFAALVALFALILTLPAMLLKQISGDFKPPADANQA